MPLVRLDGTDKTIEVGKGANLRKALIMGGATPHRGLGRWLNCQGMGLCSACLVRVTGGAENLSPPTRMETLHYRQPLKHDLRLSCQARVFGDCTVNVPGQSST